MRGRLSGEHKGTQYEEEGGDLDPEQVRQGREEEINCMVKTLGMFDFCSWQDATLNAGNSPTATKWIDRVKEDDDGREFVRCALFQTKTRGSDGRLVRGNGEDELMFIVVKKVHFNAKCDEEE